MNKALIFDMDGVVVNNAKYHLRAWQIFAEKHGKIVSDDEVKSWFGNTNPAILKKLLDRELSHEEIKQYSDEKEILYREIYTNDILPVNGLKEFLELASHLICI